MKQLWEAILPSLLEYGVPLVGTLVTALLSMALNAVRRYFKIAAADRALERLERIVTLTVHEVEQTIAPSIRAAAEDGVISPDEAKMIKRVAMKRAKDILGDKGMKELKASSGDLEQLLHVAIEAKVRQMRVSESMPPPPAG